METPKSNKILTMFGARCTPAGQHHGATAMAIFSWTRGRPSMAVAPVVDEVDELRRVFGNVRGEADAWDRAMAWRTSATGQLDSTAGQLYGLKAELAAVIPSLRTSREGRQESLQIGHPLRASMPSAAQSRESDTAQFDPHIALTVAAQTVAAQATARTVAAHSRTAPDQPMSLAEQYGVHRPNAPQVCSPHRVASD